MMLARTCISSCIVWKNHNFSFLWKVSVHYFYSFSCSVQLWLQVLLLASVILPYAGEIRGPLSSWQQCEKWYRGKPKTLSSCIKSTGFTSEILQYQLKTKGFFFFCARRTVSHQTTRIPFTAYQESHNDRFRQMRKRKKKTLLNVMNAEDKTPSSFYSDRRFIKGIISCMS